MQTATYNTGSAGRAPSHRSFDLPDRDIRRSRSYSRIRNDSTPDELGSPVSVSEPQSPLEESLLAYDMPSPSLKDFPMPPRSRTLPHPHAPPPLTSNAVRPAIFRGSDTAQRAAPRPNGSSYFDQTSPMAGSGYSDINGRTIHGRTSTDLLSARGPVPIHFASGTPGIPSPTSMSRPQVASPELREAHTGVDSPRQLAAPVDEASNPDRRSYSDIIAAIETPRRVTL